MFDVKNVLLKQAIETNAALSGSHDLANDLIMIIENQVDGWVPIHLNRWHSVSAADSLGRCYTCNDVVSIDMNFCPQCGTRLRWDLVEVNE